MIFETLVVGNVFTNCYIIGCKNTNDGVVIDPGGHPDRILDVIERLGVRPIYIINTHGHADHIEANREVQEATGAQILIHASDGPMLTDPEKNLSVFFGPAIDSPPADRSVAEGEVIEFGRMGLQVLHTPGHSPGGISLVGDGCVFTGDALFAGSIGRTDFPGASHDQLIDSIRTKLFALDASLKVYSGHGPESTIGWEKGHNPFFNESYGLF
ncbi:MAG: MBL fold metallo-hydrolase [Gemmatimonadota bacterium]|nr:MAG: MBL fold metallo-hydrolase [Gemmatimonadota bacterium]